MVYGQVCINIKVYHDLLLVSFTANTTAINTATYTGEQMSSPSSKLWKGFSTKLRSLFCVSCWLICDVGMKQQALKYKQDFSFWSSKK